MVWHMVQDPPKHKDCLFQDGASCISTADLPARGATASDEQLLWRLSHDCSGCPELELRAGGAQKLLKTVEKTLSAYLAGRRETQDGTRLRVQALEDIIRLSPDLIIAADINGAITIFNKGAEELTGFREPSMLGMPVDRLFSSDEVTQMMKLLYENGKFMGYKTHIITRNHVKVPVEMSAAMIRSADGEPLYTVGISRDIRSRLQIEAQLTQLALTDPLTHLFNRRYFEEQLGQEIEASRRYGNPLSLLIVDIDHFKRINDTAGHVRGDQILQATAEVIRKRLRGADMAFRIGGEEFAVLSPRTGFKGGVVLAEEIRTLINKAVQVTVSVGTATVIGADCTARKLFEVADSKLYEAKRAGRDEVRGNKIDESLSQNV